MTNRFPKTLQRGRYRIEKTMISSTASTQLRSFLALDTRSGREVIIREITGDDPVQQRAALWMTAGLTHRSVVGFSDFFSEGGSHFAVRDYVPGRSLADVITKSPGLPLTRVIRIGAKVSDVLARAHNSGIIHGVLKPSNIVLTSRTGLKVTDFGLAKLGGLPDENSEFTPPEWRQGGALDSRGDLFSLGVTLCNMASPEPHSSLNASLRRVESHHLQRILQKMIEPNPSHRIQSAEEVCHSLRGLSADLDEKTERTRPSKASTREARPRQQDERIREVEVNERLEDERLRRVEETVRLNRVREEDERIRRVEETKRMDDKRVQRVDEDKLVEDERLRRVEETARRERFVNTWMEEIGDSLPVKRYCWYKFALNVGQRRKEPATPFQEPDFGNSTTLDLLICLFSRDFEIERHQLVLTIPKEGESPVVDTRVRALREGTCRIDILICLRKELELLQSLAAKIDVESNVKAVAAVSA